MYQPKDELSFTYKGGRKVKGVVTGASNKTVTLLLDTDYIGRNVEWFKGEKKTFNISEMKNVEVL